MVNALTPGSAGLVSPSSKDQEANPPSMALPQQKQAPAHAPSQMQQHFSSQEDQAEEKYSKIKAVAEQADTILDEWSKLAQLQDTVKMDDVVKASAEMVGVGVPAVTVATTLAEAPDKDRVPLQQWVSGMFQKAQQQDAQLRQALERTRHELSVQSLRSIMAHSAEQHFARRALASAQPMGNA